VEYSEQFVDHKHIANEERESLIDLLKTSWGLDLSKYSKSSVSRRFSKIYNDFAVTTAAELMQKLNEKTNPKDFFLGQFTVNVTEMFRDPGFFKNLNRYVFGKLKQKEQIKIWSAACSSGEEPLSVAILLKEMGLLDRVEIVATDISGSILDKARKGAYSLRNLEGYAKSFKVAGGQKPLTDYYRVEGNEGVFEQEILDKISYQQQNLTDDTPGDNFDLVICRNALIYFDRFMQDHVLSNLAESLGEKKCFLALGSKESIIFYKRKDRFKEIDREYRIFEKNK
jgi:chemotaxis protein methyltransferase CheR